MRLSQAPRIAVLVAALLLPMGASACGSGSPSEGAPETPSGGTVDYLPGLAADVHLPIAAGAGPVPVVLLVPGGGWRTAERYGLTPLAQTLAAAGMLAVNATYATGEDGARFPEPAQDVVCAAGFALDQARRHDLEPGPLVLVGHSAGGHLAALASLSGPSLAQRAGAASVDCPYEVANVDGLVGLAGVYDAGAFSYALEDFFGSTPAEDPDAWHAGDPMALVRDDGAPAGLSVLLLHGEADDVVPLEQSRAFAAALGAAKVPVDLEVVPGIDHVGIFAVRAAGAPIREWIAGLAAAPAPT